MEIPSWSGEFWESQDGMGYLAIHVADDRSHTPPAGWKYVRVVDTIEDDCQVFIYRRVAA